MGLKRFMISLYNWAMIQLNWIIIVDFGMGKGRGSIQSYKEELKTLTNNQNQQKELTKLQLTNSTSYKLVKQNMLYKAKAMSSNLMLKNIREY